MKFHKSIVLAGVLMTAAACSDFGDLNVSPNSPSNPTTSGLLTGAIRGQGVGAGVGTASGIGGAVADVVPSLYVQHLGDVTYVEESRYRTVQFNYSAYYAGPLNSLQTIINLNTDEATKVSAAAYGSNANQIATARILKAFYFQYLTDRYGDIPYSQALKGAADFSPAFDKQQDIYNDLFKELTEAVAQFDGGATVQGDPLLGGDVAQWKKFANSLRAIMALRLSKADPTKGKTEFAAAVAAGLLASNADNVQYNYVADANNENPFYNNYVTTNRKDYAVSSTFVDFLTKYSDPRLSAMADPTNVGTYRGVPYAVFPVTWKSQDVSLINSNLRGQTSPINVTTYAQILFAQAEAVKLGWIAGNAKALYEAAIKASMEQYGVYTAAAYGAYIAQPDVAYSDARAIEQIGTQRWIALFLQGNEAWAEWRRTGYPVLTPAAKPLNGGTAIPRRLAYPSQEANLNTENYNAVTTTQGKDDQYTRVWWDKP